MREFLESLKAKGELRVFSEPLDVYLEIPHIAYIEVKKHDSKALLFENPICKKSGKRYDIPVVANLYGSFSRVRSILGEDVESIAQEVEFLLKLKPPKGIVEKLKLLPKFMRLKNLAPKELKTRGACQLIQLKDLDALPILTTWEKDGGPFITMGQVYTQSLDGKIRNLGMYRLQKYDNKHLGLHWQVHKDSNHFFNEYKKAGKKMPVSIAIGGDPLYTWCGTAPLPYGMFELMLYGFIKQRPARLVRSLTNPIYIPEDSDIVIEGWVDPEVMRDEGPFGDHTGYYTPIEPYPVLEVTKITTKKNPLFLATVVGKPPLEDKYMGYPTERIFLPMLKLPNHDLIDYHMPENGVFHNLIFAKMDVKYKGHAKQLMHAFWGAGQMSFVKNAIFVDKNAPDLIDYKNLIQHILQRISPEQLFITEGILDALDHSSTESLVGGKIGIDCTGGEVSAPNLQKIEDVRLLEILREKCPHIRALKGAFIESKNPIVFLAIDKEKIALDDAALLDTEIKKYYKIAIFLDHFQNDLENLYMLVWRIVNNIDGKRDVKIVDTTIYLDATKKTAADGYHREWPDDTDCTQSVIEDLRARGILEVSDSLLEKYQIIASAPKR